MALRSFVAFSRRLWNNVKQAGLVWGRELYVDATKVQANASRDSVKPRFAVEAHLAQLFATEANEEPTSTATIKEPGRLLLCRYPSCFQTKHGRNSLSEQ